MSPKTTLRTPSAARPAGRDLRAAHKVVRALRALHEAAPAVLRRQLREAARHSDQYAVMPSPLGDVYVAWTERGISSVELAGDPDAFEAAYRRLTGRRVTHADRLPERLAQAFRRRVEGERGPAPAFDLRELTEFEQAVLRKTLEIPYGEVRPYSWVAREIGRPRAVRAVGSALAHNPIPLAIPCHRVVRTDGLIGQYGLGGTQRKREILTREGADPDGLESLARVGTRYLGSETTKIVCFPTCRHARRIAPAHRVRFRSVSDALAAGYTPCRVCRPASAGVAA